MDKDKYEQRGVSSTKQEVHAAIKNLDKGLFPNAFCKILPDYLGNDEKYVTVMHADGAGTKSALAYAWWKKTGDLSVWKGIAQDAIVMNTDDLLCVGATGPLVFSSSIGRNKRNIPGEVVSALIQGTEEALDELRPYGLEAFLSGGETADVGDLVRTVIVDSTVVCRMPRAEVIDASGIREGMVVVGLCSYGKAAYEKEYNGGMGSNGLTAARHDLFNKKVAEEFPETFDPALDPDVVYCGRHDLDEPVEVAYTDESGKKIIDKVALAKLVLSPTRTYAPVLIPFIKKHRKKIGAIIHCTGGGQTKVLHFLQSNLRVVKDNLFEPGPLFGLLEKLYPENSPEPYRNFNMGHRMEAYLPPDLADELISCSEKLNVEARVVGRVEKSVSPQLVIENRGRVFTFGKS
ncbi:MAG: AIR synthase-related protein [Bacteroidia bacterium]|nr:AIR synthase-related protein [Bacteroidia bacterium]